MHDDIIPISNFELHSYERQIKDYLTRLIENSCTIEEFDNAINGFKKSISVAGLILHTIFNKGLLFTICKNNRKDLFDYVWCNNNYFISIWSDWLDCKKNLYDVCGFFSLHEMREHILKRCFYIKLLKDAKYLHKMDKYSLLNINAGNVREYLGIKRFDYTGRAELQSFLNKNNLKIYTTDTSLMEWCFYRRYLFKKSLKNELKFWENFDDKISKVQGMCNFYEKLNVVHLTEQKIYSNTLLIITTKDFQEIPKLNVKKQELLR